MSNPTTRAPTAQPLTPRELEVAALVSSGMSQREISAELGIAVRTVETHLMRLALKIPGDLPATLRVISWYRGQPAWRLAPPPK